MDLILLIGIATSLLVILITLYFWKKQPQQTKSETNRRAPVRGHDQENVPRRAQIARNQRNRLRLAGAGGQVHPPQGNRDADDGSDLEEQNQERLGAAHQSDEKLGAKKRAKLEAKAEKKAQREADLQIREEKKKKEAQQEEERKKQEQKVEEEEKKREEAERLAREEQERKEYEEYLKLKENFSIEEEGFDEIGDEEKQNLLQEFVKYIEENKVVVLEDLATHFKLKTQEVIDRITQLQANGTLTGVIDDRGKFIYISQDELLSVAKFIKQRGRISITELAESSNNLINLKALTTE